MHRPISVADKVRIDVEPKRTVQTSPDTFEEVEKTFINKYPIARAPTESIARAASPLILVFLPVRKSKTAHTTVTGATNNILLVNFNIVAIAIAPKATWDNPSPINENLFNTRVTPRREEHKAINTPTNNAYRTNGY